MKLQAILGWAAAITTATGAASCTRKGDEGGYVYRADRRVVVGTEVPAGFEKRERWAGSKVCPEGARLSPVVKYAFDPGEQNYGNGFYFGRACETVAPYDDEPARKPASAAEAFEASYVPNGPFVYWWPNGKIMVEGTFVNGGSDGGWKQFTPEGKAIAADSGARYRAPLLLDTDEKDEE